MSEVTIRLAPLAPEGFAPYGEVLGPGAQLQPTLDDGRWSLELVTLPPGFGARPVTRIARHQSYDQVFIGVEGETALIVHSPDGGPVEAFALAPGQAALIRRGVWHTVTPAGDGSRFMNLTRRDDGEEQNGLGDEARGYVENADVAAFAGAPVRLG